VFSPTDVIERAVAAVGERRQHYSRSDTLRAVSDALPGHLDIPPSEVRPLLEGLTDAALDLAERLTPEPDITDAPGELLLANGRSVFERPGSARYASTGQLAADNALRAAAVVRGAATFTADQAQDVLDKFAESGRRLGVDQAAALRGVLTSGAQVEVLCAAPGTGKSFVVGALSEAWAGVADRRVFGLTPSQVAAGVLAEEGVTAAANTAAWLGTQRRLDNARPGGASAEEPWRLRRDDLVVVDEANMAGTDHLAEIHRRCAAAGAKLLLVGDPRQLAAVGPGGALADIGEHGLRYELAEVHRFSAEWEREASLRLRDGDPSVWAEYAKHGRLRDAGTAEQAEAAASRAWLADTLDGRESLLMVGSNAAAARVSAALRAELVALGRVEEAGVTLGRDGWQGVVAGVGDLVQARRNGWELRGWEGNTRVPINRETYRVTAVRPDRGLTVAPVLRRGAASEQLGAPLAMPARYVAADVTLGYASTAHAAEGRTVDTAHGVFGAGTDLAGVLVPMTRGRDANTAWVVTTALAEDAKTGETFDVEPRTAQAILSEIAENARVERSALAEQERAAVEARSTMTHLDQLIAVAEQVTTGRTAAALDRLAAAGHLTARERAALAADDTSWSLERLLRTAELAGHDPHALRAAAVTSRALDDARSPAQVIHHRIATTLTGRLAPHLTSAADLIPRDAPEDHLAWFARRAQAADQRRHELGTEVAEKAPEWAVEALDPVPADLEERARWEHRAGWAASWRELADHTDETDPLGAAPRRGLVEKAALFRVAHEALQLIDAGHDEAGMTDGRLRMRIRALEREEAWAPRHVDDELAATHERASKARADATLWAARAEASNVDPADRERLRAAAVTARREAEDLAERVAELERADEARARWFAHTAVTRDNAHRAAAELRARGVDPDDTIDHVSAQEWLDAHRADQAADDAEREIHEPDLHDPGRALPPVAIEEDDDIRAASKPDPTERSDAVERRRIPTIDETAQAVARAQAALAEIEARHHADAERAAREAEEVARAEELARWAEHDDTATADDQTAYDAPTLER
jgi:hypothetical protein